MGTGSLSIFHKLPQRVDCRIWDGHHEPTQILENHSLSLGEFRTQQRTKHILVECNRTIEELFPLYRAVAAQAIKTEVEQIEAGWTLNIVGIDEDEAIREAFVTTTRA